LGCLAFNNWWQCAWLFTMYLIGIKLGRKFFENEKRAKVFGVENIEKIKVWFANWGYWVIFANRFLSGTRSVISLFAGIVRLNWLLVLGLSTLSALIWNGLLMYAGYVLGVNWKSITDIVGRYNQIAIGITLVGIAAFLVYKFIIKKKREDVKK